MVLTNIWKLSALTARHLKTVKRTIHSGGMELEEIVRHLKNFAPLSLAESWDNVGLLVEPSSTSHLVSSILLTNDLTEAVMNEAIQKKRNLIISYHPPIFTPLKKLTKESWKEQVIVKAVENRIAIYSPHTAFDVVKGGVNDWLASGLGKGTVRPIKNTLVDRQSGTHKLKMIAPKDQSLIDDMLTKVEQTVNRVCCVTECLDCFEISFNCNARSLAKILPVLNKDFPEIYKNIDIISLAKVPVQDTGVGRLCTLDEPMLVESLIQKIKDHLKLRNIRVALGQGGSSEVESVAICAGSGGSILKGIKADMYLTGEMSHHDVIDAVSNGIHVVLGEHSNTERGFFKDTFSNILYDMLDGKVTIENSTVDADPISIV